MSSYRLEHTCSTGADVCLCTRHEQEVLLGKHRPEDIWPAETVELVKRRQEEEKKTRLERLL